MGIAILDNGFSFVKFGSGGGEEFAEEFMWFFVEELFIKRKFGEGGLFRKVGDFGLFVSGGR